MNSPKKFRVWDGEEMHEPPHDYVLAGDGDLLLCLPKLEEFGQHHDGDDVTLGVADEEHEVMFYTGLTDAEGTEICEGDILEYWGRRNIVSWGDCHGRWDVGVVPECTGGAASDSKVIGNRYENPELLEEEDGGEQ